MLSALSFPSITTVISSVTHVGNGLKYEKSKTGWKDVDLTWLQSWQWPRDFSFLFLLTSSFLPWQQSFIAGHSRHNHQGLEVLYLVLAPRPGTPTVYLNRERVLRESGQRWRARPCPDQTRGNFYSTGQFQTNLVVFLLRYWCFRGKGRMGSYFMGPEFWFQRMKMFWRWTMIMVAERCECTYCRWTVHLEVIAEFDTQVLYKELLWGALFTLRNKVSFRKDVIQPCINLVLVFKCFQRLPRASLVAQTVKNWPAMEDPGSIPGEGRSPGEGNCNPLQYSCLENSMDRGAWRASTWGCKELDTTEQLTQRSPG